ncbi:MAG: aldo/keto reductase [Chloroflexi bacterium]|nr:aldo/keto reductase [Chloroflexota bacterium]
MQLRQLGKNGPLVSAVCLGTWPIGGGMGAIEAGQAIATIHAALDAGVTFVDTAEGYRDSEDIVGRALQGRRDEVFLATKLSGDHSKQHMTEAIENSLRQLQTDRVDLYQIHSPKPRWPVEETMGELLRLRDSGKIRYIGVSNFSAEQTKEAQACGPVTSSQPNYSLLFREAEESILPHCMDHGIGVMAYAPLGRGLLTGKYGAGHRFAEDDTRHDHYAFSAENRSRALAITGAMRNWVADRGRDLAQFAIAWVLANPAVTCAIVGAKTPEQARHNAAAGDWRLSQADLAEIEELLANALPGG